MPFDAAFMLGASALLATLAAPAAARQAPVPPDPAPDIVITASVRDLIGKADTSSEGLVTKSEIDLRPVYRVGQILETVPGLTVTAHSGEGKANQYLLRGFNLDHGTDLATSIDGMPVNMRTHAHGQGYTDVNFLIPELATGIDFTKGPYSAREGDFASVGSVRIGVVDQTAPTLSASIGSVGDRRLFAAGSIALGATTSLLAAGEDDRIDGPWINPDRFRKLNAVVRLSRGGGDDHASLTLMGYDAHWHATTDQPTRAIDRGLIGRLGSLDPSDGGRSNRFSLSATIRRRWGGWQLDAEAYAIRQRLTLFNDFTHFLLDPVNGDQHAQDDRRTIVGGRGSASRDLAVGQISDTIALGVEARRDAIDLDLVDTIQRAPLATVTADHVVESSIAASVENRTRWTPWLRTVIGGREDVFDLDDTNHVGGLSGRERAALFQPKASLILGPWARTEFYLSAGRGFHSNDGRAGSVGGQAGPVRFQRPSLLARSFGYEIGIRSTRVAHLQAALTLFDIDFSSELTYDADVGQTSAGRPSRRRGVEASVEYRPARWIEFNSDLAFSRARYRGADAGGNYIADAPQFIGSAGILIDHLGHWFGAVQFRDLGAHPLTNDDAVRSPGYREINLNLGYVFSPHLRVHADIFNVTNSGNEAADYYYTTRLAGEPTAGVAGVQIHPLEPRSARFTATATF